MKMGEATTEPLPWDTIVSAVYHPGRTDDLKPGMAELIGQRLEFRAEGVVEEPSSYAGEGWMAFRPEVAERLGYLWVPMCDLTDVEIVSDPAPWYSH